MMNKLILSLITLLFITGCSPVGSESWCNKMNEKPKADWSTNEATDYAEHCVFSDGEDSD